MENIGLAVADSLWLRFKTEGRMSDYRSLFDSLYIPLCRYADFYLKDRMDAEEIVLDLFMYLWKNRDCIEIGASVRKYLFRSVRNRCLNFLRSRHESVSLDDIVPPLYSETLSSVDMDDISFIVEEAVASLPPRCREVFVKSREDEFSNAEIADRMGISVKTVEAQMTKALKILRVRLKKFYIFTFIL